MAAGCPVSGGEHVASAGTLDEHGNRYWTVDVSRMLPVYRDLYERIFVERLRRAGLGEAGTVRRARGAIVFGGPDDLLRRGRPATIAQERLVQGDSGWAADLDREWRASGRELAAATTELERRLGTGEDAADALATCFDAKVRLNAQAVDSVLPRPEVTAVWWGEDVPGDLLPDVLDGCYQPASGELAFDAFERESLVLAQATPYGEEIPYAARRRFVQHGLFYRYDALDPGRRERVLVELPREAVTVARRAARTEQAVAAAIRQIDQRPWRRRYHRQWAYQQLVEAGGPAHVLFEFAGSARDYDEAKRRLNMPFWRTLFALCDALCLDLRDPGATADGLCESLARHRGAVPLDPLLTGPS